jgi:hypothetical protein
MGGHRPVRRLLQLALDPFGDLKQRVLVCYAD